MDSVSKIRINESLQMKEKRRLYRPSTSKKRETPETTNELRSSRVLKFNESIIKRIFASGKLIREYIETNRLQEREVIEMLEDPVMTIQVEIFIASKNLIEGEAETYKEIEWYLIEKLKGKYKFLKQVKVCEKIEGRIGNLITERLKYLNRS